MGYSRANILKGKELDKNSVVKDFFITAEENSVVCKEERQTEEVSVCKESLLTASTAANFASVQKESNEHFLHIPFSLNLYNSQYHNVTPVMSF